MNKPTLTSEKQIRIFDLFPFGKGKWRRKKGA